MERKFRRTVENFVCAECGESVTGNGYTNHCPRCLWSCHVDVYPGDRRSFCRGMMEPTRVESRGGLFVIMHRCVVCGREKRNMASPNDHTTTIIRISACR